MTSKSSIIYIFLFGKKNFSHIYFYDRSWSRELIWKRHLFHEGQEAFSGGIPWKNTAPKDEWTESLQKGLRRGLWIDWLIYEWHSAIFQSYCFTSVLSEREKAVFSFRVFVTILFHQYFFFFFNKNPTSKFVTF